MSRTTLRRAALFAGPLGYIAVGLVHPVPDPRIGDPTGLFIFLHLVQPVLIGLLAYGLWSLVDGLAGRAAQIARFAVVPFALAYTVFETVAGTSMGLMVQEANKLSAADRAAAQTIVDNLDALWIGYPIYLAAGLSWLVASVATGFALRGSGRAVTLLIGIGGALFAIAHPFPPGPIGMTLVLAGFALHEYRTSGAPSRVEAAPALQTP
jgi:hypothetical protein